MDVIYNIAANFWLSLGLFYAPMALCLYAFSVRTWRDYQKDVTDRDDPKHSRYYTPKLTVGLILGRALMAIMPLANLLAAIFDVGPEVFGDFFRWIGRVFDFPLVPARKKPE